MPCGDGVYAAVAGLSSWKMLAGAMHTLAGGSYLMVVTLADP